DLEGPRAERLGDRLLPDPVQGHLVWPVVVQPRPDPQPGEHDRRRAGLPRGAPSLRRARSAGLEAAVLTGASGPRSARAIVAPRWRRSRFSPRKAVPGRQPRFAR